MDLVPPHLMLLCEEREEIKTPPQELSGVKSQEVGPDHPDLTRAGDTEQAHGDAIEADGETCT